jgi:hypothetical protein
LGEKQLNLAVTTPENSPLICADASILPQIDERSPMTLQAPCNTPHPALGRLSDRALLRGLGYINGAWVAAFRRADRSSDCGGDAGVSTMAGPSATRPRPHPDPMGRVDA